LLALVATSRQSTAALLGRRFSDDFVLALVGEGREQSIAIRRQVTVDHGKGNDTLPFGQHESSKIIDYDHGQKKSGTLIIYYSWRAQQDWLGALLCYVPASASGKGQLEGGSGSPLETLQWRVSNRKRLILGDRVTISASSIKVFASTILRPASRTPESWIVSWINIVQLSVRKMNLRAHWLRMFIDAPLGMGHTDDA
ncbi:hypothetical protein FOZ63_003616, partial [Perkinsus olseni]